MARLIKQAAKLNDAGIKLKREPRAPKAPLAVPPEFSGALKQNRKAQAAFGAFSPSHRREYVEWITEAKQETTRQRRITQAIEWIAEGKSRNWKYERT